MSELPARPGTRPRTTASIPHSQVDQQPPDGRASLAALESLGTRSGVSFTESGISVEGARAAVLDQEHAGGPGEAFMIGHEFAHVHAQGDHSLHATLPVELAAEAEAKGWAEPHYLVRTGRLPATIVMIYAPRDDDERAVVESLLAASYEFARGR